MTINSRVKGAAYERELVYQFRVAMPGSGAKRGLQFRGAEVPDVDIPVFWIEAKRGKKPNPRAALAQAKRDTDGRIPVAVVRDDRKPAFIVMELHDFLTLVEEWWPKHHKR